jgi:hypothetical protein
MERRFDSRLIEMLDQAQVPIAVLRGVSHGLRGSSSHSPPHSLDRSTSVMLTQAKRGRDLLMESRRY